MAPLLDAWRARAAGLGGRVRATVRGGAQVEGVARDLDDDGALLVDTPGGTVRVVAGDVHLLRESEPPGAIPEG